MGCAALAPFAVFASFPLPIPALPAISADLGVGVGDLQLLVSGYALGLGTLLLTGGALADRFGPGRVWVLAMVGFALSSAASAVAGSAPVLVASRIAAGAAGAALLACSLSLVATAVPAERRPGAMALWGAAIGAGLTVGPIGGGLVLESGQWRPAFAVLAAAAALAGLAGLLYLPAPPARRRARFDVVGTVTLAVGLGALILAVTWAGGGRWDSPRVLVGLAVAAVALGAFWLAQRHRTDPMLAPGLLRLPEYRGGLVAGLALALSILSMLVLLGPYLQLVFELTALEMALWYLPMTGLAFLVALAGARIGRRFTLRTRLTAGLAFSAAGLAALAPVAPSWTFAMLIPGMVLAGFGVGIANPALGAAAVAGVVPERSGVAAGAANTARQLGNALGIAALGAVIHTGALAAARAAAPPGLGAELLGRLAVADLAGALALDRADPALVTDLYATAQTGGMRLALLTAAGLALLGCVLTAWLMRTPRPAPVPAAAAARG